MSWRQTFDEEITDFDAVSPAWDNELDALADFDSETDADGDLNANLVDAVHDGSAGLEVTFDNNTAAYGTLNADAVNQTSGVFSFWFNANDIAIQTAKNNNLATAVDGASQVNWRLDYSAADKLRIVYRPDGGALTGVAWGAVLGVGWHHILYMFKRSSAGGADDGYVYLYVDGVSYSSVTGVDNDTYDWDTANFGMIATSSTTFAGSFYMDTIKIDPVGSVFASTIANKNGDYGMAIPILETTARYGSFTDPATEKVHVTDYWIDPNTLTMATNDKFIVSVASGTSIGGNTTSYLSRLQYHGTNYEIQVAYYTDGAVATTITGGPIDISDEWTHIRVFWFASTGAGNDDGFVILYINETLEAVSTGIDNDQKDVGTINFGACSGLDAGTSGIFYMDDCRWSNDYYLLTGAQLHARSRNTSLTALERDVSLTARKRDTSLTAKERP